MAAVSSSSLDGCLFSGPMNKHVSFFSIKMEENTVRAIRPSEDIFISQDNISLEYICIPYIGGINIPAFSQKTLEFGYALQIHNPSLYCEIHYTGLLEEYIIPNEEWKSSPSIVPLNRHPIIVRSDEITDITVTVVNTSNQALILANNEKMWFYAKCYIGRSIRLRDTNFLHLERCIRQDDVFHYSDDQVTCTESWQNRYCTRVTFYRYKNGLYPRVTDCRTAYKLGIPDGLVLQPLECKVVKMKLIVLKPTELPPVDCFYFRLSMNKNYSNYLSIVTWPPSTPNVKLFNKKRNKLKVEICNVSNTIQTFNRGDFMFNLQFLATRCETEYVN